MGILEATSGGRSRITSFMANADCSGAAMFLPLTLSLALAAETLKEPVIGRNGFWAKTIPWVLSGSAAALGAGYRRAVVGTGTGPALAPDN